MMWMAWLSFAVTLAAAVQLAAAMPSRSDPQKPSPRRGGLSHKHLNQRLHGRRYSSIYNPEYYRDECMSQSLTCVPEDDCVAKTPGGFSEGRVCPINFVAHDSLCVLPALKKKVEHRTQAQVVDYCRTLRTRPYYFQNAKEWREFYGFVTQHADEYYDLFMLDARWEKDHDRWEWLSTGEEIEWEKLLQQANCFKENKEVVSLEDGCLGFYVNRKSQCLQLQQIKCTTSALPFFCKDGSYRSPCGQNENSLCCASPTYSYYSKNKYGGPGSHGIHGQTKRQCWVKVDYPETRSITCHNALDKLGNLQPYPQPVRIGRSYYYFSQYPCRISRPAVISGMEVHDFIVSFMLTEEVVVEEQKFVFGLKYEPEDDEFFWSNGKPIHYYNNETFWADGQPDKQSATSKVSCVVYRKNGRNSYAWHLLPSEECTGPSIVYICEMPIRSTKLVPSTKKVECGQRLGRGVLARSARRDDDDEEEALYGEFPWHVAVVVRQPRNYKKGRVMQFACSGVLIHPEYVLTSAHCTIYSGTNDLSVSFGEWDLNNVVGQIFDTKEVAVNEVIIPPKHKSTSELDDVALLKLENEVDVDQYPHIGMGCLPYPRLFYEASGEWDCYTVGWPTTKQHTNRRILQRIESEFLSNSLCRSYTKTYYDSVRENHKEDTGYDKYGSHSLHEEHDYFEDKFVSLICTKPYKSYSCLDDNTPILVCKKAAIFTSGPLIGDFYDGPGKHYNYHDSGNKHHGTGDYNKEPSDYRGRAYGNLQTNHLHLGNTRIINSFGDDRFDSDKWYVMGIGHDLNSCDSYDDLPKRGDHHHSRHHSTHQVFTPVHSYLSFIHQHLEPHPSTPDLYVPDLYGPDSYT